MLFASLNKKSVKIIITLIVCLILIVAGVLLWAWHLVSRDTIYDGIFIDGINVSGLHPDEAAEIISLDLTERYKSSVLLKYMDRTWTLNLSDILFKFEIGNAVNYAYSLGRNGSFLKRAYEISKLRKGKTDITLDVSYSTEKLKDILYEIKKQVDVEEKNAEVYYANDIIVKKPEVVGKYLNVEKTIEEVKLKLNERVFDEVNLVVEDKMPEITYDDIKKIDSLLSSFSTNFNPQNADRAHNIRLACEKINNTLLMPGEIFSMDKALGPRTPENGYKNAPIIINNKLEDGVGGGVCQVTSTLYNAVLKAKLEVKERVHHSMPLHYVGPGLDATIAEGYIDFKFANSKPYAVLLTAEVYGASIQVNIYGRLEDREYRVELVPEVVEEYLPEGEEIIVDNSIPDGQKVILRNPSKGLKVVVYRLTYDRDGNMIIKEKLNEDIYKPVKAKVKANQKYYDKANKQHNN